MEDAAPHPWGNAGDQDAGSAGGHLSLGRSEGAGDGLQRPLLIAWLLAPTDRAAAEALLAGHLAEELQPTHRAWVEQRLVEAGFGRLIRRD